METMMAHFTFEGDETMPVREVLQLGHPLLREACSTVSELNAEKIGSLVTDLQDTLAHWRSTTTYGRGIAAPQIGVMERIVFMNVDEPWVLINPEIIERSTETMVVWDACLSFLCIFFQVTRNQWIRVRYQDINGESHEVFAEGEMSELLQHEIDHLDGILALDRITDMKTLCTREEFEKRYRSMSPYSV
ncbi:peptide deformylase [Alicyclobacillus curvatus]|jgi:peptide deformylase|nr:peptide deformylase [Alicyclobacillus curvatus]